MRGASLRRPLASLALAILLAWAALALLATRAAAQPEPPPAPPAAPVPAPPKAPKAPEAPKAPPKAPAAPKAAPDAPKAVPKAPELPKAPKQEPPPGKEPRPLAPGEPEMGLPPGHPPIAPSPRPRRPSIDLEQLRRLREEAARRERELERGGGPPGTARGAMEPRHPRDEHGYCLNQQPNDPPQEINLLHGWLGVNNEKAVPEPPIPPRPPRMQWWHLDNFERVWPWWKWRLTPHPWRYENHHDHCDPRNQPIPLFANVLNVGVLLFLLVRFGKKPLRESLEKRRSRIMAEVERATDIQKSAKARLRRYEDELDHLDERLAALREQYALEGEAEEKRLIAEMNETRERLLADADFRIEQESKQARDELSRRALEAALAAAQELLEKSVSDADHERLADEYLEELGRALSESKEGAS